MQEVVPLYGGCSRRLELCVKRAFHFPLAEHQFVFWILLVDGQFRVFDDWAISVKEFPCPVRTFSIHSINRNFYAPYRAFSSIYTQVRSIQLKHLLSHGFYHSRNRGARANVEGGEMMNASDIQKELRETLLEFVKRASKKDATAAEVEALPAVAQVLKDMVT